MKEKEKKNSFVESSLKAHTHSKHRFFKREYASPNSLTIFAADMAFEKDSLRIAISSAHSKR